MGCEGDNCRVSDLIADTREGFYVCSMCGLVKDNIYDDGPMPDTINFYHPTDFMVIEEIKDMLDRVHIPITHAQSCFNYYKKKYKGYNRKAMVFSIYFVLNSMSFTISLKDLLNVNGLGGESTFSTQKKNENVLLDVLDMVEKYCIMLNLNYTETSLIKEKIKSSPKSGHTPLTTIAGNIYLHCKESNKKYSVKKISQITQVSTISIQRYIKNKNVHVTP